MTTAIDAGHYFTCGLTAGASVKCWGSNDSGQLGNGTITDSNTPVDVTGVAGATALTAGAAHTCAVVAGGAIKCWGSNFNGQLGNGTGNNSNTGGNVLPDVSGATAVAAGTFHTCALLTGGAIKCWGYNQSGELGNGTNTNSPTAVGVLGFP